MIDIEDTINNITKTTVAVNNFFITKLLFIIMV